MAFTTMLQPGPLPYIPPTLSHEESTFWSNLQRLSSLSGVTRSSISSIIAQAHGPWLLHLAPRERISILEVMASLYACIGYRRKEVYILREILGCIMDLVVCGREEDGLTRPTNVPDTGGLGLRGHVQGVASGDGAVGIRFGERDDGNDSILQLLKHICRVLGVDLEAVRMMNPDEELDQDSLRTSISEPDTDITHHDLHGWPELQVGVVREAVAVAEALPGELMCSFP
jgi:trafficking protein particle complex subunit 9